MYKKYFFVLFFFIGITRLFAQNDIKVLTYNIWYDDPNNTGNTWAERKAGVIETLKEIDPDIFCVQEALVNQVADLEFGKFKHLGVGRDDGKKAGEYSAIFYDTTRFKSQRNNTFWLSGQPDSAGLTGWDAVCVRIATWVQLINIKTNKSFFVFNTHFDHVGDTARLESVKLIKRKISEIAGNQPVILTGDFNCQKGSAPYQLLVKPTDDLTLRDSRYYNKTQQTGPDYSFVGSDFNGEPGEIIDHIFVSEGISILRSYIENNCRNGRCPSDHLPVVTLMEFF